MRETALQQARVTQRLDVIACGQRVRHGQRVEGVPFYAQLECAQSAEDQEAVHGPGHGTDRVLEELQALEQVLT